MKLGTSIRRRRGAKGRRSPESKHRLRRTGVAAGLCVVGFGLGFLVATRVLFPAPSVPDDLTEVPELRGLALEEVARSLDDEGLSLGAADSVRHPSVPRGRVLGQSPLPGQLTLPGGSVRVTVSLGPEGRSVPDVFSLRGREARIILEATGFDVEVDSVDHASPRGTVVGVSPDPGTEVSLPADVRLRISVGPPMVEVPELEGLTEEEARTALDSLGLVVSGVEERFRFGLDQGQVLEQAPPAGSMVERGSAVRLVVGRTRGG